MARFPLKLMILVSVIMLLSGCGGGPTPTLKASPGGTQTPETSVTPAGDLTQEATMASTESPSENRLVKQAMEDLSERLSLPIAQIALIEVQSVTWPDSSLGCPQLGFVYKQVPQDGALIRLNAEGQNYEYHSGGGREPFLCERADRISKMTQPPGLGDQ